MDVLALQLTSTGALASLAAQWGSSGGAAAGCNLTAGPDGTATSTTVITAPPSPNAPALAEYGRDLTACSLAFDHWCADPIRPWFEDHVYSNADLIRRWSGQDVDLARPLPPDLIVAAAQADPEIVQAAGPYQAMLAPPASLDTIQARARDIYATEACPRDVPELPATASERRP